MVARSKPLVTARKRCSEQTFCLTSAQQIDSTGKDVFRLFVSVRQGKNAVPHEESNLRPSDSALRCSTTEPQRLYGERSLLRSSYNTRPAYC